MPTTLPHSAPPRDHNLPTHRIGPSVPTLAKEIAINVVRHGFLLDDKECIVATALRWFDGAPLSAAQQRDPDCARWSCGTGFNEWDAVRWVAAKQ